MEDATSVLILDGESSFAVPVARCLAEIPGMTVHALSRKASCPLRYSRRCRTFRAGKAGETALSVDAVARAVRRTGASILLPIDIPGIRFASENAEHLLKIAALAPVPTPESLDLVESKWSLERFLAEHDLARPLTLLAADDEGFECALDDFPFPVLLKPVYGGFGRGIRSFQDRASLLDYLRDRTVPRDRSIVQSFVPGEDIDCSVLCCEGEVLAYTIQEGFLPSDGPYLPPGGITFLEDSRVLETVSQLMGRLRWNGVAHLDLRYDSRGGGPLIIEINPRFWGSLLGSLNAGVNFPHLACLVAQGQPVAEVASHPCRYVAGGAAVRQWLRPPWRGRDADFSFWETTWKYALTDPGPELFESTKACWELVRSRLSPARLRGRRKELRGETGLPARAHGRRGHANTLV